MAGRKAQRDKQISTNFIVEVDRRVDVLVRQMATPREVRVAYTDAYRDFAARGCEAATYRPSGAGQWPRLCVKRLPHSFRLVVIFPQPQTVRFILLEAHSNTSDPYSLAAEMFDLPGRGDREPGQVVRKPACCDDRSAPPDGGDLVEILDDLIRGAR